MIDKITRFVDKWVIRIVMATVFWQWVDDEWFERTETK